MTKADELMREVAHIIKQLDPPQRSKWEHYQLTHAKDGLLLIESITGSKYEVSYNGDIADQIISREQGTEGAILPLKENATLYDAIVLFIRPRPTSARAPRPRPHSIPNARFRRGSIRAKRA